MTEQEQSDVILLAEIIQALPVAPVNAQLEEMGNTEDDLDAALKRLGEAVGMSWGIK